MNFDSKQKQPEPAAAAEPEKPASQEPGEKKGLLFDLKPVPLASREDKPAEPKVLPADQPIAAFFQNAPVAPPGKEAPATGGLFGNNLPSADKPSSGLFDKQDTAKPADRFFAEQPGSMHTEKPEQANVFVESAKKASQQEENKNPLGPLIQKSEGNSFFNPKPTSGAGGLFENKSADSSSGRAVPQQANPFLANNPKQTSGTGLTSMLSSQKGGGLFGAMSTQPPSQVSSLFASLNQNPATQPAQPGGLFSQIGQQPAASQPGQSTSFFNNLGAGQPSGLFSGSKG